jgi:hypothetical protein
LYGRMTTVNIDVYHITGLYKSLYKSKSLQGRERRESHRPLSTLQAFCSVCSTWCW